jgi:cell wall-associated NlpC family hydrolase
VRRTSTALAAVATLITVALLAGPALASPRSDIASKRRQAEQARAAAERLGMQLESAINRYDTARARLADVRARIAENEREITVVRGNITTAQHTLGDQLALVYRRGDPDTVALLLGAASLDQLITSVDVIHRSNAQLATILTSLATSRRDLARRQATLAADRARAGTLVAQARTARDEITAGIARQRALARGLEGEIAQLQREEAARQRRLAAAARERLAAAKAAAEAAARATPDPGIGGSGTAAGQAGGGTIVAPPTDGSIGSRAVAAAMRWLGTPYSWGGGNASGPSRGIDQGAGTVGFDCSGLTLYAYAQVGIALGHYTGTQWNAGTRISRIGDLAVGDLVFFGSDLGHLGMYIGNGQFIHAPHTGDVVKISDLSTGYYAATFQGGVRPY